MRVVVMYSADDIFLFVRVVEVGSFINTAKLLKVNQSTIGRRIKELEERLGVSLVRRNTSGLEITDVGMSIYQKFKQQALTFESELQLCLGEVSEPSGTLRVALAPILSLKLISQFIPQFLLEYPQINLEIVYANREVNLIHEGFDLAITSQIPRQQTQKIRKIFSSEFELYCTETYAKEYGIPQTVAELKERFIVGTMSPDYTIPSHFNLVNTKTGETILAEMPRRIVINNALQGEAMLRSNKVIVGGLKNMMCLEHSDLIRVLPDYFISSIDFYLIRHPHETDSKVNAFSKFILNILANANDK